ncbi:leucyl aminopeptidase [soil metagenome]
MKITVSTAAPEKIAADTLVVIHEKGGALAHPSNREVATHVQNFAKAVDSKESRREWFCTLDKKGGVRASHLLLDSTTFSAPAPHDEPLKVTAARCVALCREHSLKTLAFLIDHELAASKASAILEGVMLGDFYDDRFKGSSKEKRPALQIVFAVPAAAAKEVTESLRRTEIICAAQNRARELVNAPHHVVTPDAMAKEAQALAKRVGLKCKILNEKQLAAQGYAPTIEVGRGSEYPPRMIILSYEPRRPALREHFGLIGKGMTFDSGGLCIKTCDSMHKMNNDMAGAAAVLGAMEAIALLKFPARVTAIISSAHNAIDGAAFYPGSIITAKNGKTIYIENTDAEGRLILSDCFARAGEEGIEVMIDLATLTGSCSAALGSAIAGLFTDDNDLRTILLEAGGNSGDDLWPLPLAREYEPALKHHLADLNNIANEPRGGAIHAANFLKNFVPDGIRWAHLDIAGVATAEKPRRYFRPGASGFGVRLLVEALRLWQTRGE